MQLKINILYFLSGYLLCLTSKYLHNFLFALKNYEINSSNLILYSKNPEIPKRNHIYFLSNSQKNLHVFVKMEYYDSIDTFYYIKYDNDINFCKVVKKFRVRIIQNLADTNREYFAIQNYGNSYFYEVEKPKFDNLMSKIPNCIIK